MSARCLKLLAALLTVTALSSSLSAQTDETLRITVRNSLTEEPVAGVLVQLKQDGLTLMEATTDPAGTADLSVTVLGALADIPHHDFSLGSPFPTPTTGRVIVPFSAGRAGVIEVAVYDALGRVVISSDQEVAPGNLSVQVNLAGTVPGSYFLIVRNDGWTIGTAALLLNETTHGSPSVRLSRNDLASTSTFVSKSGGDGNEYVVRLLKNGFVEQSRTITLPDDLSLDIWLHVKPTQIVGPDGDGHGNTLRTPWTIATDQSGNVFIAGWQSNNAFKVTPDGAVEQIIGPDGDGAGNDLRRPTWIAADDSSNVYVAGEVSDNVFKITPEGDITEIVERAGTGAGDGLDGAFGVAIDRWRNVYVTGRFSDNVLKITPEGTITQIIGPDGDGLGHALDGPWGIATDQSGDVFVSSWGSNAAFKVTREGAISQLIDHAGDGGGNSLTGPRGIATDSLGNVFVVGSASNNVFRISAAGKITQIIDQTGDGTGNTLHNPTGIDVDASGNVFIAGWLTRNAFRVSTTGVITQIIDGTGDGTNHVLSSPTGIATDQLGNVFVAGEFSHNAFRIPVRP